MHSCLSKRPVRQFTQYPQTSTVSVHSVPTNVCDLSSFGANKTSLVPAHSVVTRLSLLRFIRVPQTSRISVLSINTNVIPNKSFWANKRLNHQFLPNSQPSWWTSHSRFYKLLGPHFILRLLYVHLYDSFQVGNTSLEATRSTFAVIQINNSFRMRKTFLSTTHSTIAHVKVHKSFFVCKRQDAATHSNIPVNVPNFNSFLDNKRPEFQVVLFAQSRRDSQLIRRAHTSGGIIHSAMTNIKSYNSFVSFSTSTTPTRCGGV